MEEDAFTPADTQVVDVQDVVSTGIGEPELTAKHRIAISRGSTHHCAYGLTLSPSMLKDTSP